MVRYIRNDELYHYGVKDMKWYRRLYQYEDGSYTPLGRIHYGIGVNKKDMTPGEKMLETAKAVRDTAAGYGLVKYKQTNKIVKGDKFAKARLMKQQKADQKRAEEAYKKRQELKEKVKAEKEKLKQIYAEQKQKQEEAFRKQQEENAKKNQERKQQQEEFIKKQTEEIDKKRAEDQSQKNVDEAKSGKFDKYSNEDLKKYTDRLRLENEANKAEMEARLAKMDVPKKIVDELVGYGRTGLSAFNAYKDITGAINAYKKSKIPKSDTPSQKMAKDLVEKVMQDYSTGLLTDPDNAAAYKEDLYKEMSMIEAAAKIFEMTKNDYKPDDNKNKKKGGGK